MKFLLVLCISLLIIQFSLCSSNNKIVRARLESCPGCSLNRLKEVKQFFYEDVPHYENVEWKKISGAAPEVIFLDETDQEVERHLLSKFSRKECNDLLESKGFKAIKQAREL